MHRQVILIQTGHRGLPMSHDASTPIKMNILSGRDPWIIQMYTPVSRQAAGTLMNHTTKSKCQSEPIFAVWTETIIRMQTMDRCLIALNTYKPATQSYFQRQFDFAWWFSSDNHYALRPPKCLETTTALTRNQQYEQYVNYPEWITLEVTNLSLFKDSRIETKPLNANIACRHFTVVCEHRKK